MTTNILQRKLSPLLSEILNSLPLEIFEIQSHQIQLELRVSLPIIPPRRKIINGTGLLSLPLPHSTIILQ